MENLKHWFQKFVAISFLLAPVIAQSASSELKLRIVKVESGVVFRDYGLLDATPTEMLIRSGGDNPIEVLLLQNGREIFRLISNHVVNRSDERVVDFSLNAERVAIPSHGTFRYFTPHNYYIWADLKMRLDFNDSSKPAHVEFVERLKNQALYGAPVVLGDFKLGDERFVIIADDDRGGGKDGPVRTPPWPSPLDQKPAGPSGPECLSLFRGSPILSHLE